MRAFVLVWSEGVMRATTSLPAKLERDLFAYVAAATAAGVGILASAEPSAAKVVYTKTHQVIDRRTAYPLDMDNNGKPEFILTQTATCFSYCYNMLEANGVNISDSVAHQSFLALALRRGVRIDSQLAFTYYATMAGVADTNNGTHPFGFWVNVKKRYLGLKFEINGQTHYGWARLNVDVNGRNITGTLTGYAYETIPDKPIIAGNRGSTTGQGPDAKPVGLGRLAFGASATRLQSAAKR